MFDFIARANSDYVESLYRQYQRDPSAVHERWALVFAGYDFARRDGAGAPAGTAPDDVANLVHQYRELGHLTADLDPLGTSPRSHPLLRLEEFGLSDRDLDRVVEAGGFKRARRGGQYSPRISTLRTHCSSSRTLPGQRYSRPSCVVIHASASWASASASASPATLRAMKRRNRPSSSEASRSCVSSAGVWITSEQRR